MATGGDCGDYTYHSFNPGYTPPRYSPTSPLLYSREEQSHSEHTTSLVVSGSFLANNPPSASDFADHPAPANQREETDFDGADYLVISGRDFKLTTNVAVPTEEPGTCWAEWNIKRSQIQKLNLQKPWQQTKKWKQLLLSVLLLPDFRDKSPYKALHLAASLKIRDRLPECSYVTRTTVTLSGENLCVTREKMYRFEDHEEDTSFMVELVPQEEIVRNTSSELKLSVAVQVQVSFKEDFTVVDLPQDN